MRLKLKNDELAKKLGDVTTLSKNYSVREAKLLKNLKQRQELFDSLTRIRAAAAVDTHGDSSYDEIMNAADASLSLYVTAPGLDGFDATVGPIGLQSIDFGSIYGDAGSDTSELYLLNRGRPEGD